MIKFKVIQASKLLLYFAIGLLVLVLGLLALRFALTSPEPAMNATANLVRSADNEEAETDAVFASSDAAIEIEVLPDTDSAHMPSDQLSVLIYHTHTHEAYEQDDADPYKALEAWRTTDADHSVVRVGAELARQLESLGFEVVHDTTDHEGDDLSTAYTRSLETLENYKRRFDLYIDLHRDAWTPADAESFTGQDGTPMAQLMLLVGNGNGFDEKPYYAQNLAFAQALSERINAVEPNVCKPVLVKDGRYNQSIGVFAILAEVGHNKNTLGEALNAIPALAKGIHSLLVDRPDNQLMAMRTEYLLTHPN